MYVYVVCVILYAISILYIYNRDPYRGHFISSRYPFLCCPGMSCYGLLSKDAALVKTLGEICGAKAWPGGEICDDGHGWLSCQKCCVFSMHAHTYMYIYMFMETSWRIRAKIMEHHGTSWNIMEHHGTSWNIMEHHGTSWNIMGNHGTHSCFKSKRINELRPGVATLASSPGRGHDGGSCGLWGWWPLVALVRSFFSFRYPFW